ncbi:MAG: hypothetical protein AAGI17_09530 [Planctomycetota bacterium]
MDSIAAAAEQQSVASNEITESVGTILAGISESAAASEQASAAATDLSANANQLNGIVRQFKLERVG